MIALMRLLRTVKIKLLCLWVQICDIILYLFRHAIIVNGYVDDHTWKGIRHRNWGDDLNYYFLKELTGRPIVFYHNFKLAKLLHLNNYLCIGTLLDAVNYSNANTIVWGSGVSGQERTFIHPERIKAVRGFKTKEFCDRYKVECPNVYGDPALLLPLIYKPSVKKRYRLGIIPHVIDQKHPVISELKEKYSNNVLIIDLANYRKWTDVIDQICSCERILSSSLHGLIVSDTYQVPNCWIELTGNISGGYYKFYDYASSVDRKFVSPIIINSVGSLFSLKVDNASSDKISELQKHLILSCPFKIDSKWL